MVQLAVAPDIHSATWAIDPEFAGHAEGGGHDVTAPDWAAFGSPRLDALLIKARAANTDITIA